MNINFNKAKHVASTIVIITLISLSVNCIVGWYFKVLANNRYSSNAFNYWSGSCFAYCLGLVASSSALFIESTSFLLLCSNLAYFTASYLLFLGFLNFNSDLLDVRLKRKVAFTGGAGVIAITLSGLFTEFQQAVTSVFIAVMFLASYQSFSRKEWQIIGGITAMLRSILAVHTVVMLVQAMLVLGSSWFNVKSAVEFYLIGVVALHVLLCIITSAMLPFMLVTNQKEKWEKLANTDELTGIFGRRAFIRSVLARLNTKVKRQCTLLIVDIDHFKHINDEFGHAAGDKVLKEVVNELKQELRKGDLIGRLGGEEFAILLPDTSPKDTHALADRLRSKVENLALTIDRKTVKVTISIGMTFSEKLDETWHSMFNRADVELYKAKNRGRNQISPRSPIAA